MKKVVCLLLIACFAGVGMANLGERRVYPLRPGIKYLFTNSRDPNNWWDDVNDIYTIEGLLDVLDINVYGDLDINDVNIVGDLTLEGLTADRLLYLDADSNVASVADFTDWIAGTANQIIVTDPDTDGTVTLSLPQDYDTGATPTLGGLTITGNSVFGLNSSVFQPTTDSTTFFQVLDADGGIPILNVDSTNERVGIGIASPSQALDLIGSLELEDTTTSTTGVIYKDSTYFFHNFHHPTGGGSIPTGHNLFIGLYTGNLHMGSTATSVTHSSNNVGLGDGALYANTKGYRNMAIGAYALFNNTDGYDNVGIGMSALRENTLADKSVAIGTHALRYNKLGGGNTAIGYYAGRGVANNNCHRNIFIGYQAGDSVTTGSDNIIIGYNQDLPATNTNNFLNIGGLIYGDLSADNVGIGEVAPETTLELTHATPYITLHNSTHEDTDGGRESRLNFKGEQGVDPFEETTLARIEVAHDGTGADDKGYLDIFINDGDDGDSPTKGYRFDSTGLTLHSGARVDNSLWIDAGGIKAPGLKPATIAAHGVLETPAWAFADVVQAANEESVSWSMRVPNRMDRSAAPTIAVGWSADAGSPGVCEWQLEYLWTAVGEDTGAGAQETLYADDTAPVTADGLVVTIFTGIDVPGATDACLHCKLRRLSAAAAGSQTDTITIDVHLHGVCFGFTSNKLGT